MSMSSNPFPVGDDGQPNPDTTNVEQTRGLEFVSFEKMLEHIAQMKWEALEVNHSMQDDEKEIQALEEQLKAIRARKGKKESRRFELHKAVRRETEEMEALKRKMALEAEERRIQALMAAKRQTLDELTANATWREFALPHQLEGMHFLAQARRAVVADGMGTGKTLQALMTLDAWQALGYGGQRVLIIAPGEVVANFVKEFKKWSPHKGVINMASKGTVKTVAGIEFFSRASKFIMIINYEILARNYGTQAKEILVAAKNARFDTVICDEAHRMKETDKPTYKAIREIVLSHNTCPICEMPVQALHNDGTSWKADKLHRQGKCEEHGVVEDCVRSVTNYLSMTGTLILNKPLEAYASLSLVNPVGFPSAHTFEMDYCERGWDNKMKWKFGGESRLVSKIRGMYIRRTREDAGIILPPQSETIHELELTPETYPLQSKIMDMLAKHAQIEVDEGRAVTMMSILALITRQRQAAVWPGGIYLTHTDPLSGIKTREHIGAMYKESIKLDKAVELAEEFVTENGERVAMMSQFAEPITEVVNRLNAKGIRAVAYYGDTPRDVRDRIQTNFDRDQLRRSGEAPEWDVVVCHYTLASEGLNLTAATQTIILDEQWNPGKAEQAYARTQRIGQTEETGIHILRIKKSIDTWMASLIEEKRKIVTGFETEVTFQDLAKLFTDPPKDENGNGS